MTTETMAELESNRAQLEAQLAPFRILGHAVRYRRVTRALLNSLRDDYGYTDATEDTAFSLYERCVREDILSVDREGRQKADRIVLCTGGPHCEIVASSQPYAVCYGWFGADKVQRKLTNSERAGLNQVI